MSPAAKSSFYFGLYVLGMGVSLFFIPNVILGLFGFEPASEIWVRVLGLLAFCFGIVYVYCARTEQTEFFRVTAYERVVFFLGMIALVVFFRGNPMLILFGCVDLLGAIWTNLALRK